MFGYHTKVTGERVFGRNMVGKVVAYTDAAPLRGRRIISSSFVRNDEPGPNSLLEPGKAESR